MSLNLDKSAWERVRFGDAVKHVNETVRDASAAGIDRVVGLEHLDPGELQIVHWGEDPSSTTFTKRVRPGQTLFGKRRAYQRKAAYAEFDAVTSGDILTFEAIPERLLPELLPFLVQSDRFFAHALETSAGSLSPRTNWGDLAQFEFALPPFDEQRRLADLLWAAEDHRRALLDERAILAAERHGLINRAIDAALSIDRRRLSDVAEIRSGIQKGKKVPGARVTVPYLRVANVLMGRIDLKDLRTIEVSEPDADRYLLHDGDVLLTEGGDIDKLGRGAVWRSPVDPCIHQNHIFVVRAGGEVLPEWIAMHLESRHGISYFRTAAKRTSNLATINKAQVSTLRIGLLPADLQRRRVAEVAYLDVAIASNESEARTCRSITSALLKEVFE